MSESLTYIFTGICVFCVLTQIIPFIHYMYKLKFDKKFELHWIIKTYATISLIGYTLFIIITTILYIIKTLYYIYPSTIVYNNIWCEIEAYNVATFMIGKLAMYLFYMSLVYISFKDSSIAYNKRILIGIALMFIFIMSIIGGFYGYYLYSDLHGIIITTPNECFNIELSQRTVITIFIGATFDCFWGFLCLILFLKKLRTITNVMKQNISKNRINKPNNISNNNEGSNTHSNTNNYTRETSESQSQSNSKKRSIKIRIKNTSNKYKNDKILNKFLPLTIKMTILVGLSSLTTLILGFGLWIVYPTLSSLIDSTINAICIYLSFAFNNKAYNIICLPFIKCYECTQIRISIETSKTDENNEETMKMLHQNT